MSAKTKLKIVEAEIDKIRRNGKYLALKNKKRSVHDMERYNVFLRQLGRLNAQKVQLEEQAKAETRVSKPSKKFVTSKPVWRNQTNGVSHRNQEEGIVSRNWVKDAQKFTPATNMHPAKKRAIEAAETPVPEQPINPRKTTGTPARIMVKKLFHRPVKRTPTQLKRLVESADKRSTHGARQMRMTPLPKPREEHEKKVEKPKQRPVRSAAKVVPKKQVGNAKTKAKTDLTPESSEEEWDSEEVSGSYESDEADTAKLIDDLDLDSD